mmetsp:Transcript_26512/g.67853  ORF Transcript_26512/g.67853 Transcript_26512/m.67853 type:complete len:365 (-) Transcript_26512:3549-4643(-)
MAFKQAKQRQRQLQRRRREKEQGSPPEKEEVSSCVSPAIQVSKEGHVSSRSAAAPSSCPERKNKKGSCKNDDVSPASRPLLRDLSSVFVPPSSEAKSFEEKYRKYKFTQARLRHQFVESQKEECAVVEQFGEKYMAGIAYGKKTIATQIRTVMEVYDISEEQARGFCKETRNGSLITPDGNEVLDIVERLSIPLFHFEYLFQTKLHPAKREALDSLLELCEYHKEEGEKRFQQRVALGIAQHLPVLMGHNAWAPLPFLKKVVDQYYDCACTLYDHEFVREKLGPNQVHKYLFDSLLAGVKQWMTRMNEAHLPVTHLDVLVHFAEAAMYEEYLHLRMLGLGFDMDVSDARKHYPLVSSPPLPPLS